MPAVVLVAENDAGEIIGGIVSQPDIQDIQQFPEDYRRGWVRRVSLLSHIAIVDVERGRGVARKLIAETKPQLRADGAKWWYGLASASTRNEAFFAGAGFDILPEQHTPDGIVFARIMGLDRASTRPGRFFLRKL